ncbi:MAG: CocE/NonD family hydrolase [Defluviitaleaceae bacterium]|nr:CocE/NonD family hydrolase [Defluviitaleaceae bacterium]
MTDQKENIITNMLPMRDGVKLRTIIIKPQHEQDSTPYVITRSCYPHIENLHMDTANYYAERGIGFVVQFCRGTGGSEGVWEPNANERADGQDTIEWLCYQDWVASVGYLGSSYLALTGWIIADLLPPKVKGMYLTLYGTDRHVSAYSGGMFRHDVLTAWAMGNAGYEITADYLESCLYRPHAEVDKALWGKELGWYRKWVTAASANDPYWETGMWKTLKDIPQKVKIPVCIVEGWYDHHLGSAIKTYERLSDECKAKSHLIIGPYNHWFETALEQDSGKNHEYDDTERSFAWFNDILVKNQTTQGKISQYIIKGDYWLESTGDESKKEYTRLYLSEDCQLTNDISSCGKRGYTYDPNEPIFSHGGESMLKSKDKIGSLLQPEPNYRPDTLSFISKPLDDDLTVCGPICAKLYVSSDAQDTSFVARVINVDEHGKNHFVRGGISTLAYRGPGDSPVEYEPNSIAEISISMWDIGWKFKKGTKIRLDVQSSDFPQYSIHTNTAGVWSRQVKSFKAKQTIHFGEKYASCLELPVVMHGRSKA